MTRKHSALRRFAFVMMRCLEWRVFERVQCSKACLASLTEIDLGSLWRVFGTARNWGPHSLANLMESDLEHHWLLVALTKTAPHSAYWTRTNEMVPGLGSQRVWMELTTDVHFDEKEIGKVPDSGALLLVIVMATDSGAATLVVVMAVGKGQIPRAIAMELGFGLLCQATVMVFDCLVKTAVGMSWETMKGTKSFLGRTDLCLAIAMRRCWGPATH